MSQFSPTFLLLSHSFVTIEQEYYCTVLYTEGAKVTVQLSFCYEDNRWLGIGV